MRGKSVVEVIAFYVGVRVVLSYLLSGNSLISWERENLGWSYIGGSLGVVAAVTLLLLTRRDFAAYGLTLHSWRSSLDLGMTCYLILMIPFAAMLARTRGRQ